jgi:ribosomal protein S18 acetylase RimI-like enzyme
MIARLDATAFPMPDGWTITDFRTDFRSGSSLYLIASCCGGTVGYLHGGREGDAAWLLALYVDPLHRRLGLAGRFLDAFTKWADDQGADEALLQVAYGNAGAARLYLDAGFVVTGDLRNYYAPGRHAVELRKPLL